MKENINIFITYCFFKVHLGEKLCVLFVEFCFWCQKSFLQVNIFYSISLPSCKKGIVYLSDLKGVDY